MNPVVLKGTRLRPNADVQLERRGDPVIIHSDQIVIVEDVASDCESGGHYVTFKGLPGSLPFKRVENEFSEVP